MSVTRRQKRASQAHLIKLADLLAVFYEYLKKTPQPTTEEVRSKFKSLRGQWREYCFQRQLSTSAYDLFTAQVAQLWEYKKTQSQSSTEK